MLPWVSTMIHVNGDEGGRCHDALEAMYTFLDTECTEETRAHVQQHLDECTPCLEAFEFEAELKQVIARKCTDHMPAHLVETVRMRLLVEVNNSAQDDFSENPENPSGDGIPQA